MTRKFIALLIMISVLASGCAYGASRKSSKPAKTYTARKIPTDFSLPLCKNPQEIDLEKGKLHLSFKGAFRGVDQRGFLTDWVYFAFSAKSQEDMYLAVSQSELFDSRERIYRYRTVPYIAGERAFGREIVAGITVPVLVGVHMPLSEAGDFPSVSKITIAFNKEGFQFRNILVEDWEIWESMREKFALRRGE